MNSPHADGKIYITLFKDTVEERQVDVLSDKKKLHFRSDIFKTDRLMFTPNHELAIVMQLDGYDSFEMIPRATIELNRKQVETLRDYLNHYIDHYDRVILANHPELLTDKTSKEESKT